MSNRSTRVVAALGLASALWTGAAWGRSEGYSPYSSAQTFVGALRYLRVDAGYAIREKDPDAGYLLFDYPMDDDRTCSGSVEVFESGDEVRVVVRLSELPSYYEDALRDHILEKLRADYGDVEPEPEPPPPAKERDGAGDAPPPAPAGDKPAAS